MPVPDVDGDTAYDALTDGMAVSRYLAGVTGDALVNGVLGMNATRSTGASVVQFLDDLKPLLDIDDNGLVDAATDGLLLVRWLLGFRGDALVADAIGAGAKRKVAPDITAYLQSVLP